MGFSLSSVLASLRSSSSPFDEGTGEFNRINVDRAKEALELKARAFENGQSGVPDQDYEQKDSLAKDIDAYLHELIFLAKDKLHSRLKAIEELNSIQSIEGSIQSIQELYNKAKAEITVIARERAGDLFSAKREWVLGEEEFKHFRDIHNRKGPARYPFDSKKLYGWIFLITVIEVIVNAYALGSAHPNGPVGVAIEILMFGVANVAIAYFLGNFIWRNFYHVSSLRKTIGTILSLPLITLAVALNFFLAHYRDAISSVASKDLDFASLIQMMQQLGARARETLYAAPLELDDFKSYLLLVVGMVAFILAARKSFELDDPYPGYGKIHREQEALAAHFNDEQTNAFRAMNDFVNGTTEAINAQISLAKGSEEIVKNRLRDKKELAERYRNWLSSTRSVGQSLYAFYRDENIRGREIKATPKTFNTFDYEIPEDCYLEITDEELAASNFNSLEDTASDLIKKLNVQAETYQNKFKDIENMSPDQTLTDSFDVSTHFRE